MVVNLEKKLENNKENTKEVNENVHNETYYTPKLNEITSISTMKLGPVAVANLKPELKNKLKLDLTLLRNPLKIKQDTRFRNAVSQDEAPIGFHEEFMSKLEEFSLSWRQAAMMERKM